MKRVLPRRMVAAFWSTVWSVGLLLINPTESQAQSDPTFVYGKAETVKKAVWKVSAQAGLLLSTGNSNALTVSGAGSASRVDAKNKLALDVDFRYGQTTTFAAAPNLPVDPMTKMPIISSYADIATATAISTQYWGVKLRYDRFFSPNNLGYVVGQVMGDEPAGKRVFGGGQIGYSRQLYKSDRNELLAEVGYDLTFVFFAAPDAMPSQIMLHSLRAFLGYNLTLSKDTAINTGVEGLFNLNSLTSPGFKDEITPFQDTRVNFKTALTTTVYKKLSFRFSFKLRFDNVPAPRAPIAGTTYGTGADGLPFVPVAEKVDTLSEAALVVNFL